MAPVGHRARMAVLLAGAVLSADPALAKLKLDGSRPRGDPAPQSGGERITTRSPNVACMPYGPTLTGMPGLGFGWPGLPGWGYLLRLGNRTMAVPFSDGGGACFPLGTRGPQPKAGTGAGDAGGAPAQPSGRAAPGR